MKYQIVVDSSADILNGEYKDDLVEVKSVPLVIKISGVDYVDDERLDPKELLTKMNEATTKSVTACPSTEAFKELFMEAENTFCLTISSKMSGTFNAARVAAIEANEEGYNVEVIDSAAVSGVLRLMVEDIISYLHAGLTFSQIVEKVQPNNYKLLFVLSQFDNLVKNGRMHKFTGIVASLFSIRPLFMAHEGEIKLLKKARTTSKALPLLVSEMPNLVPDINEGKVIITHAYADDLVVDLANMIKNAYPQAKVEIVRMRNLTTFYAQEKGIIVSFRGKNA